MTKRGKASLFLGGCIAGAWVAYYALNVEFEDSPRNNASRLIEVDSPALLISDEQSETDSRRDLLESIERIDDIDLLASQILSLARSSSSRTNIELRLLLSRLAELDPSLGSLNDLRDVPTSQKIALALLDVLGDEDNSIERILAALPAVNPLTFRVEAIAHAVERDPVEALGRILSSDDTVFRRTAIPKIAAAWAKNNPEAALANAGVITEPRLREAFTLEVLQQWAQVESAGLLAYLRGADSLMLPQLGNGVLSLRSTFEILAMSNPEQVLELSEQLSRWNLFEAAVSVAARSLAEKDPIAAISWLETLPRGQEHRLSRAAIAAGYVERDPGGALAWAQNLNPPSPGTVNDVLTAIGSMDLEQVVDVAVAEIARGSSLGIDSREWMNRSADSATMARIGTRIASLGADSARQLVPRFAELWSGSDPEAALEWALDNGEVGELMLPHIALNYRPETFELAMAVVDHVPDSLRRQWIQGVVLTTGSSELQRDPEAFAQELTRFSGGSSYPMIVGLLAESVARQSAFGNPAEADRIVQSLPAGELRSAIEQRLGAP